MKIKKKDLWFIPQSKIFCHNFLLFSKIETYPNVQLVIKNLYIVSVESERSLTELRTGTTNTTYEEVKSAECFTNNFVFWNSTTTKDKRRAEKNIIVFHNCSEKQQTKKQLSKLFYLHNSPVLTLLVNINISTRCLHYNLLRIPEKQIYIYTYIF